MMSLVPRCTSSRFVRANRTVATGYALASSSTSFLTTCLVSNRRELHCTGSLRNISKTTDSTSPPASIKDPSHPYLHYHPFPSPSPGRLALSFLASRPIEGSRTILGYLPMGQEAGTLQDFREEPKFLKVLHESLKAGLQSGLAESVDFEAQTRPSDGYIHITDERHLPPAGRIGEPEDLIASVFVQDGKILAETYAPTPTYRVVTGDGPLVLPRGLDQALIKDLERIDAEEKGE